MGMATKDFVIRAGSIWGSTTELGTLFLIHGKSNLSKAIPSQTQKFKDSTTTAN